MDIISLFFGYGHNKVGLIYCNLKNESELCNSKKEYRNG